MLALAGCARQVTDKNIRNVGISEVRAISAGERPGTVLIDPRTPERFAEARIPGAVNLQLMAVDPDRPKLPMLAQAKQIVVYGRDPGSAVARAMTKKLIAADYTSVRFYAGGLEEWSVTGEVESDFD